MVRAEAAQEHLSLSAARRTALAAQGFADARPSGRADVRHLRRVVDRVTVLQVDSVNVVCRSHYLPAYSRLGPYSRAALDRMVWSPRRELFEYFWGPKASILPFSVYPLLRWRMQAAAEQSWDGADLDPALQVPWAVVAGMRRLVRERPRLVDDVLAHITAHGPVAAGDLDPGTRRRAATEPDPDPGTGRMWNWQDAKIAVEWLYCAGRVGIAARRGFERLYDLTERVVPPDVLAAPIPDAEEAQRELVRIAARAQGVASARQLCGGGGGGGYVILPTRTRKARVAELVDAGDLIPVRVEGIRDQMYMPPDGVGRAREVHARALLSPFDSLLWNRDRIRQLFGFHYRTSIYTPEPERVHGYYVLPFLLGERLVARVDVKADRPGSTLLVPVVHREPGTDEHRVAAELAEELADLAAWLELESVTVGERGDLAPALARAVARRARTP